MEAPAFQAAAQDTPPQVQEATEPGGEEAKEAEPETLPRLLEKPVRRAPPVEAMEQAPSAGWPQEAKKSVSSGENQPSEAELEALPALRRPVRRLPVADPDGRLQGPKSADFDRRDTSGKRWGHSLYLWPCQVVLDHERTWMGMVYGGREKEGIGGGSKGFHHNAVYGQSLVKFI
jgi:hypothetical protein